MTPAGPARLDRSGALESSEQIDGSEQIERFERVPAEFARYAVDLDAAARLLGLDPRRTAEVARDALPHETDPERGPLFDYVDVMNLALFAGTSRDSIPELALRFLLRFASGPRPSWYEPRHWLVRVRAPRSEEAAMQLLGPDLAAPGVQEVDPRDLPIATTTVEPPGYEVAVRLTGAEATVGDPQVRAIYDDMLEALLSGTVIYQSVSEELRMLHERAWGLGMADCVVVSRLLAQRLRDAGFQARARRGYLLGLVGSDHSWCEYFEDGRWKTLDLVFAFLAGGAGHRRIEASPEFAAACRGGRFNRLLPCDAEEASALILAGDEPAPPWALAGVSAHPWES
ncbi:transglutaminase domain protein [Catenulispora acidiphila DSM 44928]|uniref:Transglutaminase domain protein n=1 Tax=Catenulispora acidiphila (strain DSM 44928 / JCM 14897 / NBRC 102108 / NRRL B-24433 / ID139908) TaxID=479433 RepID=C7Q990_CATAD|nr:transglutaminase domain-containing protein [Catenulispora acidiphila]ACU72410.1 transglutaminase domain protein [Catenulispora acidiphila DSM 44928]